MILFTFAVNSFSGSEGIEQEDQPISEKQIDQGGQTEKRAEWNRPVVWPMFLILAVLVVIALPAVIAFRRRERKSAI